MGNLLGCSCQGGGSSIEDSLPCAVQRKSLIVLLHAREGRAGDSLGFDSSSSMGNCSFCQKSSDDGDDSDHKIDFSAENVQVITSKEMWDQKISEAARDGKLVVANFSATWCGPCRLIAPLYGELSMKYPSLIFITVDVDQLTDFSSAMDIRATPTFFFMKDGEQVDKLVGANKPELQKRVSAFAQSAT